ncbi:hypothetical protein A2V82_12815 [candidate division KSB1 bacterium RBG_16_48_16]|nr:MAG: hypothetical protein A2V82_12815 [candidate division KSB1 bacterium RBG_16_48_16]
MKTLFFHLVFCGILLFSNIQAQEKLYPNTFPLGDVTLLDGPFKNARDLNIQTLLKYNVDRLLAPYRKQAGLTLKASSYTNWDGLDGHVGGHYLSAMAINYAATGNTECKQRMEYMISELKACQDANATNNSTWGIGYAGGVPNSSAIWSTFKTGNFTAYRAAWVPWYNLHKMYAGLRDAWLYAGNEDAKTIFLKFCDWGVNITSALSDAQMESMLGTEHGGMNEIFADAYQMTGDVKYLTAAKRFSHKELLNAMAASRDNLDNKHANTQVPKAVGFQRIAELSGDNTYIKAGSFFWETVTSNRSLASGGNSRSEHFPSASACIDYVNEVQGPESCNTNNILKLTEDLFRVNPLAKYADFYERALYNHILSTQHPVHGGYVYFTPARPRHYRVYSAPNQAMWCCVGTGMENHGKYGEFIYTHQNDSLFLNLFIASEFDWKEKGVKIKQETNFPYEEQTKLLVTEGSSQFKLMIRYPSWVNAGALKVIVNGDTLSYTAQPSSYIAVDRSWTSGDVVEIILPMHNAIEQLPNVPAYIAFLHGPILLGAKTGTESLTGLIADDSRWGHIASGSMLPIDKAPIIVEDDRSKIAEKLVPVTGKPLTFATSGVTIVNSQNNLEFEPFYKIHDSRYMMYWMALTNTQYQALLDSISAGSLEKRTIDSVAIGAQQFEADHAMKTLNSYSGTHMGEFWRDARNGGYFSYNLKTNGETNLSLMVRYWGNESGNRTFDILIDDAKLATENLTGKWNVSEFRNVEYAIPDSMVEGKDKIRVKFQAPSNGYAGGVFYLRLLRPKSTTGIKKTMNHPHFYKLNQNYPNPFNPTTHIAYSVPQSSYIRLKVYNLLGQEVTTLFEGLRQQGNYTATFDGRGLSGGVYLYRMTAANFVDTKKTMLLK